MRPEEMSGRVLGHYRIIRPLGYGGTATVFLAQDTNLQREVAVKVFQPKEGETRDFLRRFAREARVLAQLDHPNILPVYDYGEQDAIAYLIMPHMAGGSLRDMLRVRGVISELETIRLISQILNALQYAHDRGLIHRDIKPGNMLFKADGTLLLSDFGLVKVVSTDGEMTMSETASMTGHTISGTPDYMPPEQINGQQVTPASDIYAMGIVLYEMLTGSRPFSADNYMGMLMKHLYEQPRPLRMLNPQISAAMEMVVMRAMEKDPAKRYQRPVELLQALQQAIDQGANIATDEGPTIPASFNRPTPPPDSYPQPRMGSGEHSTQPISGARGSMHLHASVPVTPSSQTRFNPGRSTPQPSSGQPMPGVSNPITPPPANQSIPMPVQRPRSPLIVVLLLVIIVLIVSMGGLLYAQGVFGPHIVQTPTPQGQRQTPVPSVGTMTKGGATSVPGGATGNTVTTVPELQTTTACPAAGMARAAVMQPLALGNHQNIIYIVNEGTSDHPTFGTVKRRDVITGTQGIEISKTPNTYISEAQVSQDGQWTLFTAKVSGQVELRMVRMDGQGLQTLYCAPSGGTIYGSQWSFDQRSVVFDVGPAKPTTYFLDVTSGNLQPELVPQSNLGYVPRTWLDNRRVYMIGIVPSSDAPPQNIYLLDIQKGANQHDSDLQRVVTASLSCASFDSSYDVTQLLISTCTNAPTSGGGPGAPTGLSTLTVQPATGGTASTIYSSPTLAVTTIRAVTRTTLLLLIENYSGDTSQNGLWKMNMDGTGLTRLSTDSNNSQSLCTFTQYSWSNVSPDGSMYALQSYDPKTNTYGMYYGSLSGGTPTQFAGISDGTQLYLAGWTRM